MMKIIWRWRLSLFLFLLVGNISLAQTQTVSQPIVSACPALRNAVVLIVRHAEKPESGYELSPAGKNRADAYVNYFKTLTLDSRLIRPDYLFATADTEGSHRPRLTIEPLGRALGLKIDDRFKKNDCKLLAREIQSRDHGKCILIAWHHGEIPELIEAFGADPATLLPDGKWPSQVFDWVLELHFDGEGRCVRSECKRINENLMPGDSKS